jgi:hypothetical protein
VKQAGTCAHEVKELGFVTAGGRTQGHPAGAIGLVGGRRRGFLALPGGRGLTLVNHKTARYRVARRPPLPRPLGFDEQGREVITFPEGETVGSRKPWPAWTHAEDNHMSLLLPGRPQVYVGQAGFIALEGEMIFELEGEPERVIRAGDAFWEPGGDVIHYQAANNLKGALSSFVVVMVCLPDEPMLTLVSADELAQRRDRRFPRG